MFCFDCGKKIRDDSVYCTYCGKLQQNYEELFDKVFSKARFKLSHSGEKLKSKPENLYDEPDLDDYDIDDDGLVYPFDPFEDHDDIEEIEPDDEEFIGAEFEPVDSPAFCSLGALDPIIFENYSQAIGDRVSFDDYELIVADDGLKIYEYGGTSKNIVIPSEMHGIKIVGIEPCAFKSCYSLESVEIPEGVTKIGREAFFHCENLKKVVIPKSVKYIGSSAFEETGLTEITLPPKLTAIRLRTFAECKDLRSVTFLSEGNYPLKHIETEAFSNCRALSEIKDHFFEDNNIPFMKCDYKFGENAICAQKIDMNAFIDCISLKSININCMGGEIDVDAFFGCYNIEKLAIFNAEKIKSFNKLGLCVNELYISYPGMRNITIIDQGTFSECPYLESVTLEGVAVIGASAFAGCASLKRIDFKTSPEVIMEKAFEYCIKLNSALDLKGLTGLGDNAFYACCSLENVELSDRFDRKYLSENVFGTTNLKFD